MAYSRPELRNGASISGRVDSYGIIRKSDEVLKGGANGLVHRAVATKTGKTVALKLLSPREQKSDDELETIRRLFKNEIKKTHLVTHWNIVQIKDWGEVTWKGSRVPFMVMDLARENLQEYLQNGVGLLPGLLYCALLSQAVEYINSRGLIHRDIKPENVLMTVDDSVQLSDLGIAEFRTNFEKDQFEMHGGYSEPSSDTQHPRFYFSPEQLRRAEGEKDVDLSRSDIFQLGLLLHRILLGTPVRGQIRQNSSVYANLPPIVRNTLWEMIQEEPTARPSLPFCAKVLWVFLVHMLSRLYVQANQLDPLVKAAFTECFQDKNRFPLRYGEPSRWDSVFSWLSRHQLLRINRSSDAVLTASGVDLKNLVLGNRGWHDFIRLYSLLGREPAVSFDESVRELKARPGSQGVRGWGWNKPDDAFHCKTKKSIIAVLPPFQFGQSYWVEAHTSSDQALTIPFGAPLFVARGKTRREALLRICSELRRDGLRISAGNRLLHCFKEDKGATIRVFGMGILPLLADIISALCREEPTKVSIKCPFTYRYVLNIKERRRALPRGLVEFEFTHLAEVLIRGQTKQLEAIFQPYPEVCVVRTKELSDFLRMVVTFGSRLDQEFFVVPTERDWRFYFLRFDFVGFERRRVANFLRVAAETERVLAECRKLTV